jgi:carboxypeptidase Taq
MDQNTLYSAYTDLNKKAADLHNAAALLEWDQEVYMPPKGAQFRAGQLATLNTIAHELLTSPKYEDLLQALQNAHGLTEIQQANIRLSYEDFQKNKKLPSSFVQELSQQTGRSFHAWLNARKANDFKLFAPELQNMLLLKRKQAEYYGYSNHPYDALLDEYEKGANVALLDPLFVQVRTELTPVLKKIGSAPQVNDAFLYNFFPANKQWDFSLLILKAMGYDFEAGRQDYSEHPFTTSFSPLDVRITTRVNENDLASLLFSSIHEGGHALYEQGLPQDQYGLPLASAASLAVHESQSRLWENNVGRSLDFWQYYYPILQKSVSPALDKCSLSDFYKAINKVSASLIRTESDEISYHFHVMIRYEIEKQLLEGSLSINELPEAWNQYYFNYLGIKPQDDKSGVLQDVHWSHGSFGYFPTYSLGSFFAAQLFQQAQQDLPNLTKNTTEGNFSSLLSWLRSNIHVHGRHYTSAQLAQSICGQGLNLNAFMSYVKAKYGAIYGITDL